jgi:hypothetical protein
LQRDTALQHKINDAQILYLNKWPAFILWQCFMFNVRLYGRRQLQRLRARQLALGISSGFAGGDPWMT